MTRFKKAFLGLSISALLCGTAIAAPTPRAIAAGDSVSGEITTASPLNYSDGSRSQLYSVQLAAGQALSLRVEGALNAAISLFHRDQLVSRAESAGEGHARLTVRAEKAGRYTLAVSGADARAFGPYQLSAQALLPYDGAPLTADRRITDWLAGDKRHYILEIDKPGVFVIGVESSEFDPQLRLSGNGVEVEDDDGGNGLNARVTVALQPGKYTVDAMGFDGSNGAFDLSVETLTLPDNVAMTDGSTLPIDGMASGFIAAGESRTFTLALPERQRIQIDASSSGLDTLLVVQGQGLSLRDDDSGGNGNSRLSATLDAGQYTVSVSSLDSRSGVFQLAANSAPATAGSSHQVLRPGRDIRGQLHPSVRDVHTVEIPRKGRYEIAMNAGNGLDGVISLQRDGEEIVMQDDSEESLNPRVELELEAGTYTLVAWSFDPSASGSYTLALKRK